MPGSNDPIDWDLIERLLIDFGGIADDPIAVANLARLKAGHIPRRRNADTSRRPAEPWLRLVASNDQGKSCS